jgi:hypothetical protein
MVLLKTHCSRKVFFRIIIRYQQITRMQNFKPFTPPVRTSQVHSFLNLFVCYLFNSSRSSLFRQAVLILFVPMQFRLVGSISRTSLNIELGCQLNYYHELEISECKYVFIKLYLEYYKTNLVVNNTIILW